MRASPEPVSAATSYFAVAPPGLEPVVAAELRALGIDGVAAHGGVEFEGDVARMRLANLHLRCATRVLLRLGHFRARSFFELERHAARVPWARVLAPGTAVALRVTSTKSKLYHERAIAERLYAAIEAATGAQQAAAAVDEEEGSADAQLLVVRVLRDEFTVSADSSGEALHRRGYREAIGKAPLRESLAAALLQHAGWRGDRPLLDPFCGSGTIPIEAALLARRIAPGIARADRAARAFAFTHWPQHDERAWQAQVEEARRAVLDRSPVAVRGSDRNAGAIRIAVANAERAGVAEDIEWEVAALGGAVPPAGAAVVTNPPYGVRVSEGPDLRDLYAAFGRWLRERVTGGAAVLSPPGALEAQLGMVVRAAADTRNGGLVVRVLVMPPPVLAGDAGGPYSTDDASDPVPGAPTSTPGEP